MSIKQENIKFLNAQATNYVSLKYLKQWLKAVKGKIEKPIIIVGYFNILLWVTASKPSKRKQFLKDTEYLNNMINPVDFHGTPHAASAFRT